MLEVGKGQQRRSGNVGSKGAKGMGEVLYYSNGINLFATDRLDRERNWERTLFLSSGIPTRYPLLCVPPPPLCPPYHTPRSAAPSSFWLLSLSDPLTRLGRAKKRGRRNTPAPPQLPSCTILHLARSGKRQRVIIKAGPLRPQHDVDLCVPRIMGKRS